MSNQQQSSHERYHERLRQHAQNVFGDSCLPTIHFAANQSKSLQISPTSLFTRIMCPEQSPRPSVERPVTSYYSTKHLWYEPLRDLSESIERSFTGKTDNVAGTNTETSFYIDNDTDSEAETATAAASTPLGSSSTVSVTPWTDDINDDTLRSYITAGLQSNEGTPRLPGEFGIVVNVQALNESPPNRIYSFKVENRHPDGKVFILRSKDGKESTHSFNGLYTKTIEQFN